MSPAVALVVVGLAGGAGLAGCGSDEGASEADRTACERLQAVVDELTAGRSAGAIVRLEELGFDLTLVDDDELRERGDAFFSAITEEVPNFGDLTFDETAALGRSLATETAGRLGALLERCGELDLQIDLSGF